jgi:hypothetical protein
MASKALLVGVLLAAVAAPAVAAPDFSGTWERYPPQGEEADPRYAPSDIPDPQLKPEYKAQWAANQEKLAERIKEGQPAGDNYVHCLPDGMPAMMQGMFPMEIFQRAEQINITQEAFNQTRRIYMNETLPSAADVDPSFYGQSVGHWEGDTLVIETTGIKADVQFHWTPHSEDMKITERLSLVTPDMLHDEVRVEDSYLEKPWTYTYAYRRTPGYKLQEYVCENNREYVDDQGKTRLKLDDQ